MFASTDLTGAAADRPAMTLAELSHLEALLPDGECRADRRFAELRAEVVSHDVKDSVWSTQAPHDCVDEASMESFPASDPPGRTACHA